MSMTDRSLVLPYWGEHALCTMMAGTPMVLPQNMIHASEPRNSRCATDLAGIAGPW